MRIENYLQHHAIHSQNKIAIVCRGTSYTYGQLFDMVKATAKKYIFNNNKVVVFRATQSIDCLVTYFALHMANVVAVPLAKDTPDDIYEQVNQSLMGCDLPSNAADILYTSGTTGQARGVIVTHDAIIANAENLIQAQQYTENLTFIINGSLNHIGSLSKVYPIIVQGGTLYLIDGMKDMNAFYEALEYPCDKMATFLVPASIRMLLRFSATRLSQYANKIDFIETGAAPISRDDMLALCRLLPHSRLYNTYASTETGIVSTYNFNDGDCVESCVGFPMKHSSIEINDKGVIVCRGKTLMCGYIGNDNKIENSSVNNAITTQDLGFIDSRGMLHLQGRNDDIINIGGYKVAPVEVENVALSVKGIKDCACIAVSHPIAGNALKLLVVCDDGVSLDKNSIATFLKAKLESYKVPTLYQYVTKIERTFNGKIDRKAYK